MTTPSNPAIGSSCSPVRVRGFPFFTLVPQNFLGEKQIIIKEKEKKFFVGMKEKGSHQEKEKRGRRVLRGKGQLCLQFLTNERKATSCHVS